MPCLKIVHFLLIKFLCKHRISNRIWFIMSDFFVLLTSSVTKIVHYVKMSHLFDVNYVPGSVTSAVRTGQVNMFRDFLLYFEVSAFTFTTSYCHILSLVYMYIYNISFLML
jgi:hypothetical protein